MENVISFAEYTCAYEKCNAKPTHEFYEEKLCSKCYSDSVVSYHYGFLRTDELSDDGLDLDQILVQIDKEITKARELSSSGIPLKHALDQVREVELSY